MIDLLAALLSRSCATTVVVNRVTPLSGGASSATFAIDACRDGIAWPLIFQRSEGAAGLPKAAQAKLQQIAGTQGLPVAEVIAIAGPDDDLGDGFVMARVAGESLAPRWLKDRAYADARAVLTGQCAAALARLHSVSLDAFAGLPLADGSAAEQRMRLFEIYLGFGVDMPAFDLAFAWLRERVSNAQPSAPVHGDFRSGNFIINGGGLAAILDWELAHFGDPVEDLGWLCVNAWRFGHWQRPVGGFGEREALYTAYEEAGGRAVDRKVAHVWEVYGTLRWGMACLQLADDHLSGRVVSVERATIGRRVSEVAADLFHLLKFGTI